MSQSTLTKPRQRNREETEAALAAAASVLFAQKGYEATTTSAIAAAAGYSEALIQRYFGGKEGLLLAVIRINRDEGYLNFLDMPLQSSIEDEARMIFRHVVKFMEEHSAQMRIIISRVFIDPAFLAEYSRIAIHGITAQGIAARLRRYAARGLIGKDADIGAATELLMSLNFQLGFVHPELHQTKGEALEKLIDSFALLFARAVR